MSPGGQRMLDGKRFGSFGVLVEAFAIGIYCVLRIREHLDYRWTAGEGSLTGTNLLLLRTSMGLIAGAVLISLVGMIFDKDRLLGILALCLVMPMLVLMAIFQGIG